MNTEFNDIYELLMTMADQAETAKHYQLIGDTNLSKLHLERLQGTAKRLDAYIQIVGSVND